MSVCSVGKRGRLAAKERNHHTAVTSACRQGSDRRHVGLPLLAHTQAHVCILTFTADNLHLYHHYSGRQIPARNAF